MKITQYENPSTLEISLEPEPILSLPGGKTADERVIERIKKSLPQSRPDDKEQAIRWGISANDRKTNGVTLSFPR